MSLQNKVWHKPTILLLWGIACFCLFQVIFPYHFFYKEQNQLFLSEGSYVLSYFDKPAWLARLTGDFLTQFYYYLYAGATILTLSLLILGITAYKTIRKCISSKGTWVAFILALIIMSVEARFSIHHAHKLSSIAALTGGFASWWLFDTASNKLSRWWIRALIAIILSVIISWLFGYGFIIFTVLEIINITIRKQKPIVSLPISIVSLVIPFFIIAAFAESFHLLPTDAITYSRTGKWENIKNSITLEKNLKYDNEYYFGNLQKVVNMYESDKEDKTDVMSFFYCLSLARMNILPDKLQYIEKPELGTFIHIGPETPFYNIKMINELYYALGDMTYTERAALMAKTFSPDGRNVRMAKRLAEANLVNGDEKAAMKYIRLLSKTLVYKNWAKEHTPATQTERVKAEIEYKKQFINTNDNIRLGDDCYTILTQLLDSNPKNDIAFDYLLCSDLLSGQREVFKRDYEKYGPSNKPLFTNTYNSLMSDENKQ